MRRSEKQSDNGPNDGWTLYNGEPITISGGTTNLDTFRIWYDFSTDGTSHTGDSIALTVIPEPASVNLLVMLGAAYWMRRRIHRKRSRWED